MFSGEGDERRGGLAGVRRPHLGGALGRAIADALERDGVITRAAGRREVALQRPFAAWLNGA